jgi:hypothetical protein
VRWKRQIQDDHLPKVRLLRKYIVKGLLILPVYRVLVKNICLMGCAHRASSEAKLPTDVGTVRISRGFQRSGPKNWTVGFSRIPLPRTGPVAAFPPWWLLSAPQAAALLNIKPATLQSWRIRGEDPDPVPPRHLHSIQGNPVYCRYGRYATFGREPHPDLVSRSLSRTNAFTF